MPKIRNDDCATLQKNHDLKYLTYEGPIHNNQEKIRIISKGIFVAPRWIESGELPDLIHFSWYKANDEFKRKYMWKKTDFKININEIKLYEIIEDSGYEKTQIKPMDTKTLPESPGFTAAPSEAPAAPPLPTEIKPIAMNQEIKREIPVNIRHIPEMQPVNLEAMQTAKKEESFGTRLSNPSLENDVIEFVPIQELVLEESGKTSGVYQTNS